MCNLKIIKFDDNISLEDFEDLLIKNKDNLNSMMIHIQILMVYLIKI